MTIPVFFTIAVFFCRHKVLPVRFWSGYRQGAVHQHIHLLQSENIFPAWCSTVLKSLFFCKDFSPFFWLFRPFLDFAGSSSQLRSINSIDSDTYAFSYDGVDIWNVDCNCVSIVVFDKFANKIAVSLLVFAVCVGDYCDKKYYNKWYCFRIIFSCFTLFSRFLIKIGGSPTTPTNFSQ